MSEQFEEYRIHSVTFPDNSVGLVTGFACLMKKKFFTRSELEELEVPLYEDDLIEVRGENCHQEELVLQGKHRGKWITIKSVSLLSGKGPAPDYGDCQDCGIELEESEFAVGVICSNCLEKEHERRKAATW